MPYKINRYFQDDTKKTEVVRTGLSLNEAQEHCHNMETSSTTCEGEEGLSRTRKYGGWFDGYASEDE